MKTRQLVALFLCSLIANTYGAGSLPLLPVYARQMGAGPALAGNYLAFTYLAMALGTLAAGWLSDRFQRRKETVALSVAVWIPLTWATAYVTAVWQLVVLTAAVWFLGGVVTTTIGIIAGLFAEKSERGRVFGILAMTGPGGLLIGGLSMGSIADRWGFAGLFVALALWSVPLVLLAAFMVQDKVVAITPQGRSVGSPHTFGASFFLLLVAVGAAFVAGSMGLLGRSLVMNQVGFHSSDISRALAVAGAVSLPLAPLLGRLSDRAGRRQILAIGYLLGASGLAIFAVSASLWHFLAASALLGVMGTAGGSAGPALVADLVPPGSLGRGMSLYSAMGWLGGVLGFALMGTAVQSLGGSGAFLLGALLALFAIAVLLTVRPLPRERPAAGGTELSTKRS